MEPTVKNEIVEEFLTALAGEDRREVIKADRCMSPPLGCGKEITGFRDNISAREYSISGFCQVCQDKIFGENW